MGRGSCATRTSRAFVKELSRHTLTKGVWTRLLSPLKARARAFGDLEPEEEVPGGAGDCSRAHPLWTELAKSRKYRLCWKRKSAKRRHINIGEVSGLLEGRADWQGERQGRATGDRWRLAGSLRSFAQRSFRKCCTRATHPTHRNLLPGRNPTRKAPVSWAGA